MRWMNFLVARAAMAATVCTALAAAASASFHLMQIEQVIAGANNDPTAQAIQLRMRADFQNVLGNSRLVVRDAAGANPIIISDPAASVPNRGIGIRVLLCTPSFAAQTTPPAVSDFTITTPIPMSYFAAGTLEFQNNTGTIVYWRLSWGGGGYTGPGTGSTNNDPDGNFNPPIATALPSATNVATRFTGAAAATSSNNLADYALTAGNSIWINNAGTQFTLGVELRACCLPGGTCMNLPPATCIAQGGTPQGPGVLCASNPCAAPATEACCLPSGLCQDLTLVACSQLGGTPQGAGTRCQFVMCPIPTVRCCSPDGTCDNLPPGLCVEFGGTPDGPGTICDQVNNPCPQFTEACCDTQNVCMDALPMDCIAMGGTPGGPGTNCFTYTCPTVACCFPDGTCEDITGYLCFIGGGISQGVGSVCSGVTCPAPFRCCLPEGLCIITTPEECQNRCGIPSPNCTGEFCCPGDLNFDGIRDLADLAVAINSWDNPWGLCHLAQIINGWNQPCPPTP